MEAQTEQTNPIKPRRYLAFDLLVERAAPGFRARVIDSPAGEATAEFSLPFSSLELENFVLRLTRSLGAARRRVSRPESDRELVKRLGSQLFGSVFSGAVLGAFRASLSKALRQDAGLRIRLRLNETPELAAVPWELLYDPSTNRFLNLTQETLVVRYLDLPIRVRPLMVTPPIEVLVMISSPEDNPLLDVGAEWNRLQIALGNLLQGGLIKITRFGGESLTHLQRAFRVSEFNVLHFIGPGSFDEASQNGALPLENEQGLTQLVSGRNLGVMLGDHPSLRLVVLNACEGARSSPSSAFAEVSQGLVQQGVPAVIATQFEVSDDAAIVFAEEFYTAIVEGNPVDVALGGSRRAIYASGNDVEWAAPALYMRSPDGRIFEVGRRGYAAVQAAEAAGPEEAERWAREEAERQPAQAPSKQAAGKWGRSAPPPPSPPPPPSAKRRWPLGARWRRRQRPDAERRPEVGPPAGVVRGMGSERDPPRSAFALLDCPGVVVAEQEFDLTVGISPTPTPGVTGGPMVRPESSVGPYTLTVQVVADGFRLAGNAISWRRDLPVTTDIPYPMFSLRVAAKRQLERIRPRAIQAMYSVNGQTIGMAVRSVAVVRTPDLVRETEEKPQEGGVDISIPSELTAPDLTVRIVQNPSERAGRLLWTFESPYRIPIADVPVVTDIGKDPEVFARKLVEQVAEHEGHPGLYQYLMGIGNTVADQVPQEFWAVLAAVAERVRYSRPPSVLFLSEEPYVPWELAVVDPPLDPNLPPFLSAQARSGRWVLGHRRPKLPPPIGVRADAMAVVWGVYDRQEWRLVEAEDEAAKLREMFGAASVEARSKVVIDCLKGNPKAEILHFAVHGIYNPTGPKEGLILVDGRTLDPMEVRGVRLEAAPFVFLNACQVGTGTAVLGDYAGMAEAFLYAGAAGVVAPLWSIDDALAKEIALRFYQQTLVEGRQPAEVFRAESARFTDSPEVASSTFLAYQFFGNPAMKLTRGASR